MQYWDRPKYDNAVVQEGKNQCNILTSSKFQKCCIQFLIAKQNIKKNACEAH